MRKFTAPFALTLAALTFVCIFAESADAGPFRKRKNRGNDCCPQAVAVAPSCGGCGVAAAPYGYGGYGVPAMAAPCNTCGAGMAVSGGYIQVAGSQSYYQPGVVGQAGYIPSQNVPNILPASATEVKVRATDSGFEPATMTVAPGTTVRWTNDGKNAHTVTSAKGDWGSGEIAPGQDFTATFTQPGTFEYHCKKDGKEMKGTIVVK